MNLSGLTTLPPQSADVLSELKKGPRTTLQLMRATGSLRPAAIVHLLRIAGYRIHTEIVKKPTRHKREAHVALYTLQHPRRKIRSAKGRVAA